MLQVFKSGAFYFALVFVVGFALGIVRTLWIVPRTGPRAAELMEAPIMLAVSAVAAGWLVRMLRLPPTPVYRLGMGGIALVLMLLAEFTLVLSLRGLSLRQYLATRDPISGTVYYLALVLFALMPMLVARR